MPESTPSPSNRRRHERTREELFCPVSFDIAGERRSAYVVDLSKSGLQIKRYDDRTNPGVSIGSTVEYQIYTSAGQSSFTGVTQWMREDEDGFRWGARFAHLSSAIGDPFVAMLDALPVAQRSPFMKATHGSR